MNSLQRIAIILKLVSRMREQNSWCGETHIQKGAYLLQDLAGVAIELEFVLYKHGPFSFELRDELTAMRADSLLELSVQPLPYGPKLIPTAQAQVIEGKFPKTLEKFQPQISFIADCIGDKGVTDLEKLATAVFILSRESPQNSAEEQAQYLHEIKPHISLSLAREAILEAQRLRASVQQQAFKN